MRKVAYNACFGGFRLSRAGVLLGREISGNPQWGGACLKGDNFAGWLVDYEYGSSCDDIDRHDNVLIAVIEKLGDEASGPCSKLRIEEVNGPYRISEHDGNETIETMDTLDWIL
jgi:hypothetical protein